MLRKLTLFLLMLLLVLGCARKEGVKVQFIDGVEVILNPKRPLSKVCKCSLEEDLSIGVKEGDENYILFRPSDIEVDAEGNIYVLDSGNHRVQVFDRNGKYLRTIGRKGEGPGEIKMAFKMSMGPDGKLYLLDIGNFRITIFNRDGEYVGDFKPKKGFPNDISVDDQGEVFLSSDMRDKAGKGIINISRYDQKGEALLSYGNFKKREFQWITIGSKSGVPTLLAIPTGYEPETVWTIDPKGNLYVGYGDKYEISFYSREGKLKRRFGRKWTPMKIAREEKRAVLDGLENVPSQVKKQIIFPDFKPAFDDMIVDEEGNLWVSIPSKEGYTYDIFNRKGMYINQVHLDVRPRLFKNGYVYAITATEEGVRVVKRYRLIYP